METTSSQRYSRLTEAVGVVCLILGLLIWLSLVSYHPEDPSWNTATASQSKNLIGPAGSYIADLMLQAFGLVAFLLPVMLAILAWHWVRSRPFEHPRLRAFGALLFVISSCVGLELGPKWLLFGAVPPGGVLGAVLGDYAVSGLNLTGAALTAAACFLVSLYLATNFRLLHLAWAAALPAGATRPFRRRWSAWREARAHRREEKAQAASEPARRRKAKGDREASSADAPPWAAPEESSPESAAGQDPAPDDIPIRTIDDLPPEPAPGPVLIEMPLREPEPAAVRPAPRAHEAHALEHKSYEHPPTSLLNEAQGRPAYDEDELKAIAARIKAKFEEFNVLGSVVQINPGPVVTTFEYKPEAGIKYTRITTLAEDLCLALQAESILIERIPGKPTVGIEVPNSRREIISLRQILESEEFAASPSRLTMALGKDISGRIKVAALESMPHLLIAGSTGSGKSVMLNTIIMSVLYKSTPDEVRMILVDPKRLEMGLYEGIPHLLTPVITDAKKATNALRNAVLEMERRLRLLASQGVRNIDQFNRKVRQLQDKPIALFEEMEENAEDLQPLPHILILIDELADLMMLEGHNVEQSITRLAQMARAVGMHLILATQRPSVDVITGLIKANFPARLSFRVATRVDSRTVLDVMGAEHLLGKGDMLFLPPGSSRLVRVHGAFVTESEINRVVEFWKAQAAPEYDRSFLIAPPSDDEEATAEGDVPADEEDPLYQDAVRVVIEMGKASTSTLQRRLRLGYGRAARILDMMQRDGIIGPPDGSKPRELLKRPDWLDEVSTED
jgi:S-DNA-T family DNA segregation ATPase FtsK/SpoIIIE